MTLSSFDIFDTTLLRWCGKPNNVYAVMAKRLYPGNHTKQDEFMLWRNRVPRFIKGEYGVEDIYKTSGLEAFPEYTPEQLLNEELKTEEALLMGNKKIIDKIQEQRKAGHKIAFISDMHLPVSFLRSILIREGAFEEGDGLYVSCDKKARKDTGELYDIVRKDYLPDKWIHYGDNKYSDHDIARKKGIDAILVDDYFNEPERELVKMSALLPHPYNLSIVAGISRAARNKFGSSTEVEVAADFVAAAYIPYIIHVLKDAKQRGIKTLFFVSRDGFIFRRIAECLPHDDIDLRYLFVSRKSLHSPFFYVAKENELEELNIKLTSPIESYQKDYELCCGYFEQEGLFDDNVALVDVGWRGSTRLMINRIRQSKGKTQLMSYYWGQGIMMLSSNYGEYDVFSYPPNSNEWKTFLLEVYFSACPWPTTIHYTQDLGKYHPVFKSGQDYSEDIVVKTNTEVCCWLSNIIGDIGIDEGSSFLWMSIALDILIDKGYYVDWSILKEKYKEKEYSLTVFSHKDTINYIRGQFYPYTTNIDVTLDLTYGPQKRVWIKRLRHLYLYLRTIKNKLLNIE